MCVLTRQDIETRLNLRERELLRNPRRGDDGRFDIENDSYDLAAGTAIWKESAGEADGGTIKTQRYLREPSEAPQPTVTVQPGQMIFIVTLEDVIMPLDLCGTVYSRNSLALKGILALNAGHVDPGYEGPIAIRLINLRATSWTLTLGDPIFTITFQTVKRGSPDPCDDNPRISQEKMIARVRDTADAALSNALYDLYAQNVTQRLNEFKSETLAEFRDERDQRWVRQDKIWSVLFKSAWRQFWAIAISVLLVACAVAGGVAGVIAVLNFFNGKS